MTSTRQVFPPRRVVASLVFAALVIGACARSASRAPRPYDEAAIGTMLSALADDSMQGRATGTPGYRRAADLVAKEMERIGLVPAGDSGFFQRIPVIRPDTTRRIVLGTSLSDLDTIPAARKYVDLNVVGVIEGADPALAGETLIVGAHLDHVGIGRVVNGDSIYNGADDDASGIVAVLGIARALKSGPPPARTIVFAAFAAEERGGLGARWYVNHPVRPIDRTVGQFQIEMIARPDSLAGGPGKAWLTGYERSTMGERLAAQGIPIVPDPRPTQNFFQRSDNYRFALAGIPAHTLSSFNLHTDYHRPSDEARLADVQHMKAVIDASARAVRLLASGPKPEWKPGGRPEPVAR